MKLISSILNTVASCKLQVASNLALGTCFLALSMASCTDDLSVKTETPDAEQLKPGITIRIPNIEGSAFASTRDGETVNATQAEGEIQDLWLVVCPSKSDNSGVAKVITLMDKNSNFQNADLKQIEDETLFTIDENQLEAGDYKVYVLGNLSQYIDQDLDESSLTEKNIRELILNFGTDMSGNIKQLKPGYLPMACLAEEVTKRSGSTTTVGTGGVVNFQKGDIVELQTDPKFLCSKVRYTILVDQTDFSSGLISAEFVTSDGTSADGKPNAGNLRKETNVVSASETAFTDKTGKYISGNLPLKLEQKKYPTEEYPKFEDDDNTEDSRYSSTPDLENYTGSDFATQPQKAWQGTVYLPENLQTTTVSDKLDLTTAQNGNATYLHFPAKVDGNDKDFVSLIKNEGLKRGKFYDVVAKLETSEFTTAVSVADWTLQTLAYDLMGPTELIVETTELAPIKSGDEITFWYRSNIAPEDIKFEYPQFEGKDFFKAHVVKSIEMGAENSGAVSEGPSTVALPQFIVKTRAGGEYYTNDNGDYLISVEINPEIPYKTLEATFNAEGIDQEAVKAPYEYFEIVAGNLHKKIKATIGDLKPYLDVDPRTIIIDVREYVTSAFNSGKVEIEFETNVQAGTLKMSGKATKFIEGLGDNDSNGSMRIAPMSFNISEDFELLEVRDGKLVLNIENIFDGEEFWKKAQSFDLTFTLSEYNEKPSDFTKEDEEEPNPYPKTVTIQIKPYTTDYIIHFKSNKFLWEHPHIYVYQCLNLPSDLKSEDTNYDFRGKTVGYGDSNPQSALEYAFSNNISFNGWYGYGGSVDPNMNADYQDGFVHLGGIINEYISKFNPANRNTDIYNYNTELNSVHASHQSFWPCTICSSFGSAQDYNTSISVGARLFAGVSMEREYGENEGWYKYTLSGMATPGKALIIFFNGHVWDELGSLGLGKAEDIEDQYRYPSKDPETDKDTAGIPLFDYPDNEGWFVFDGDGTNYSQYFTDEKPKMYRLYWPYSKGSRIHIYIHGTTQTFTDWNNQGCKGTLDPDLGYYYFDIKDEFTGNLAITFWNPESLDNRIQDGTIDKFTLVDGNYCAWIDDEITIHSGKPTAPEYFFNPLDRVVVKWRASKEGYIFNNLYTFGDGENWKPWAGFPGYLTYDNEGDIRTVSHKIDRVLKSFHVIVNNGTINNTVQPQIDYTIKPNEVTYGETKYFSGDVPDILQHPSIEFDSSTRTYTVTLWE